jgi:hypothetical protein
MNDIWEEVWGIVSETFQRIAASLGTCYPGMSWSSGHSDNNAFPFRAYAAFNQGSQGSEDVVASVDFHRSEDRIHYTADIGRDDGTILADGPAGVIDVSEGVASARAEIGAAVGSIVRFLEESEQVVRDAISQQRH